METVAGALVRRPSSTSRENPKVVLTCTLLIAAVGDCAAGSLRVAAGPDVCAHLKWIGSPLKKAEPPPVSVTLLFCVAVAGPLAVATGARSQPRARSGTS